MIMTKLWKKTWISPAKVNLILRVGEKRRDAFHEIASLMAKLNWGDEISCELQPAKATSIDLKCSDPSLETEKNLAYRAASEFSKAFKLKFDMKINLQKRIPMEGGLGGGSSNAASVLSFLSESFLKNSRRDQNRLRILAAQLGSDVPFFLARKNAAWCWGRGEKFKELSLPPLSLVLVFPASKISTAWAYQGLGRKRTRPEFFETKLPNWLLDSWQIPLLENDFESLALGSFEELAALKKDLMLSGAVAGQMTGSGSCFFGVYASDAEAEGAASFLMRRGWRVQKVSVGRVDKSRNLF